MKTNRTILLSMVLALIAVLSAAAILAQDATEEPSGESTDVPSSFSDNRINGDIFLGGLAIYCQDENGNTDGNTFQNGGISVWGPDGQEFIRLTVDQLRGNDEIMQASNAEMTAEPDMTVTPDATMDPSATEEPMMAPLLLARAETPNGTIWFFRTGDDSFALQGTDNTGKFYTYSWTGCALGVLEAGAPPILPMDGMPTMESTAEVTAEATVAS